nr:PREDICTED: E3 ubiquitin-protein ligase RNF19A-like [Bemisia tabaci]
MPAMLKSNKMQCPLCLDEMAPECFPKLSTCSHWCCLDCLQHYLRIEITESRIIITCPECSEPMHPNDIRMILNEPALYEKYEDFMVRRVLAVDPDTRWCPAPDCCYAVVANGCASCPKLKCGREGCNAYFCYHCKALWHPNQTCTAARAKRASSLNSSSILLSLEAQLTQFREDVKVCPRCQVLIVKMDDGSCNHMTCSVCGAEFCWLCLKEIGDLHYLSPSGCTFWGKKPWSRKKKLLWQLGTLIGAPVGIALIAGIAVPAIIIGIPVLVGRKLYVKYAWSSRLHRTAAIMTGVITAILIAPILAGLAVGVGVPVLLFYVYGVIPVSLCRNGGCGITTSASGVRIDFNEENEYVPRSIGSKNESPVRKSQSDSVFESSETGKSPSHSNKKRKGSSDKPVKSSAKTKVEIQKQKTKGTNVLPESSPTSSKTPSTSADLEAGANDDSLQKMRVEESATVAEGQCRTKPETSVPFRNGRPLSSITFLRNLFFRKSRSKNPPTDSTSQDLVSV